MKDVRDSDDGMMATTLCGNIRVVDYECINSYDKVHPATRGTGYRSLRVDWYSTVQSSSHRSDDDTNDKITVKSGITLLYPFNDTEEDIQVGVGILLEEDIPVAVAAASS